MINKTLYILGLYLCLVFSATAQENDNFVLLHSSQESMTARLELIQTAKEEINLCYFIISQDQAGSMILSNLIQAKKRGVKVRVLIDAYYNEIEKKTLAELKSQGLEIKLYAPFNILRPNRWWKRMHNKFMTIDEKFLITGGRNIENQYFDLDIKNYIDRDLLVYSPDLNSLAKEYFNELWNANFSETPKFTKKQLADVHEAKEIIKQGGISANNYLATTSQSNISYLDFIHNDNDRSQIEATSFIHDDLNKTSKNGTSKSLIAEMEKAQSEIIIETPYFVLTKKVYKILKSALKRGVKVKILTNSMASNDVTLSHSAYLHHRQKLLNLGAEIYELFAEKKKLHAKSYLIDQKIGFIGSFNFNGRSHHQDFEILTRSENPEIVSELMNSFDMHLNYFLAVESNGDVQGYDVRYPHTTALKKIGVTLQRLFISPILKLQL